MNEAAKLLDVCVATIHEYKRTGLLPYHKLQGRVYLKRAEVLAQLRGQQRTQKLSQAARNRKGLIPGPSVK